VYQDIVRSLGAAPVVFPAIEWARPSRAERWTASSPRPAAGEERAGRAEREPRTGLLFYTYFLIADKAWFDALPAAEQKALAESARVSVTEKWSEMQTDERAPGRRARRAGATYTVVPVRR